MSNALKRVLKEASMCLSVPLLRLHISSALLGIASSDFSSSQGDLRPSFSCSCAFLHALWSSHVSFTSLRILTSLLLLRLRSSYISSIFPNTCLLVASPFLFVTGLWPPDSGMVQAHVVGATLPVGMHFLQLLSVAIWQKWI